MHIPQFQDYRSDRYIYALTIAIAVLFWITDAFFEARFFYNRDFWDTLIFNIPGNALTIRLSFTVGLFLICHILIWFIAFIRQRQSSTDWKNDGNVQGATCLQSTLLKISGATNPANNLSAVIQETHMELAKLINAENFYVALYNKAKKTYSFPYSVDKYDNPGDFSQEQLSHGLTDYVRRTGWSLIANEKTQEKLRQSGDIEQVGSLAHLWLGVPLKHDGQVIGVMAVFTYSKNVSYSNRDIELMNIIAEYLSMAIRYKIMESQLKRDDERLKSIIEYMKVGIQLIQPDTKKIVHVNRIIEEMIGIPKGQIIGRRSLDFFKFPINKNVLDSFFDQQNGALVEYVRADGVRVSASKMAVAASLNGKKYILESFVDVTSFRKALEQLKHTLGEKIEVLEGSPIGIMYIIHDTIHQVNQYLALELGYTVEELIGQNLEILFGSKEAYDEFNLKYGASLSIGKPVRIIHSLYTKDGSETQVLLIGKTMNPDDIDGGVIWILDRLDESRPSTNDSEPKKNWKPAIK